MGDFEDVDRPFVRGAAQILRFQIEGEVTYLCWRAASSKLAKLPTCFRIKNSDKCPLRIQNDDKNVKNILKEIESLPRPRLLLKVCHCYLLRDKLSDSRAPTI